MIQPHIRSAIARMPTDIEPQVPWPGFWLVFELAQTSQQQELAGLAPSTIRAQRPLS